MPKSVSIGIILVDVDLNWFSWFQFVILERGSFFRLIDCMIFLPLFLDIIRMSVATVSFLAQLDFRILYPQNAFL